MQSLQQTNELLTSQLSSAKGNQSEREKAVNTLQTKHQSEIALKDQIVNRLETNLIEKERELEKMQRVYQSKSKSHELLKQKMNDITTNMTAQVAYTIDELREELAQARKGMSEMQAEHENSMSDAKRIFTKVSRKMAESLDEVTQERD